MSSETSSVDSATIEKTKQQIRGLVQEIAQLSRGDLEPDQYYAEVMHRIVTALAAIGGAVWTINNERQLRLDYQINLNQHLLEPQSEDAQRHVRLLQQVISSGEAKLVPPLSGSGDADSPGNPTNSLLVLAPMKTDDSVEGVLEIFQRPDSQTGSQQGYLRFLIQMSDLVGDYLKSRKLRHFSDRQSMWAKIDHFSKEVHNSLDVRDTAYTIANEGRRLIGCDRVSVTVARGGKQVVEAVSGQDTMDSRSNVVSMLRNLATRVCATGEALWYNGSMQDLPPQVENALEEYVDESHTKSLAVLPLFKTDEFKQKKDDELGAEKTEQYQSDHGDVIGSVIIEQIDSTQSRDVIAPRVDLVCQHSARALGNSIEHNSLFLMPVWRTIGKSRWLVTGRNLPKTLLASAAILILLFVMFMVHKDFRMEARGTLQPQVRRDVFFAGGGEVDAVNVKHGSEVKAGDVLVVLKDNALEQEIFKVQGELYSAQDRRRAIYQQLEREGSNPELMGQAVELDQRIIGYQNQLLILLDKKKKLNVLSPIDGLVTTWDVLDLLDDRPVSVGQVAMQVADPSKTWELEVFLRDDRLGHLLKAQRELGRDDLDVSFVLKSHTNETFEGTLGEVQTTATMSEDHGNSYRLKIKIDKQDMIDRLKQEEPNMGTEVIAKIYCGKRSAGYSLFHELIEWVQVRLFAI
ncbi:MAG: HlyD family efflux transporter periplasmic adaptor subunit [Pirellulaceae bacterium]|nr:HlyD family efflux transporter periplasmic adaptor subunit [Pirellulaceae bacterium]